MSIVLLWIGGILGALCRFHANRLLRGQTQSAFPWGTLLINVTGSALLGLLMGLLAKHATWPTTQLGIFFGTGFCGAYTTFSTFALETVELWQRGARRATLLNALGQPLVGGLAAWLGLHFGAS
ncbi:MAG: fluoride efflux transporter CrcB [Chloroflexi bacterium]|nr:MAG: fluoride efflux transporter CrcB [Chloroflexota bacterium]